MKKTAIHAEIERENISVDNLMANMRRYLKDVGKNTDTPYLIMESEREKSLYAISVLQRMLPTEQQQIEEAFDAGQDADQEAINDAHDYYKSTYSDK